jgi:cytidylate kinase
MAVVTIARQYGSGASVIGRRVAKRLGYQLIDKTMLDTLAKKADVSVQQVKDIEKMTGDKFLSLIAEIISTSPSIRNIPGISTDFDEKKYLLFLRKAIIEAATRDDVVIIGRGSQFILKDHPRAIRIYMVGDEKDRIIKLMNVYHVDHEKAQNVALREEKKRLAFLESFGDGSSENLLLYHLVINTSLVDYDVAVDFICALAAAVEK